MLAAKPPTYHELVARKSWQAFARPATLLYEEEDVRVGQRAGARRERSSLSSSLVSAPFFFVSILSSGVHLVCVCGGVGAAQSSRKVVKLSEEQFLFNVR